MNPLKFRIKEVAHDGGLSEIYQSMSTQLALLRRTDDPTVLEKVTSFVKCRDFLVDSYSYAVAKKDFGIYGFSFKGSSEPLDFDCVRLLVRFKNPSDRLNFEHNIRWIRDIEVRNKMEPTLIIPCDMKDCIVMIGDQRWLQNCLMFSFYTFLPRIACYPVPANVSNLREWLDELGKQQTNDGKYVASIARETWDKITSDLTLLQTDTFCGFDPATDGVGTIHHNSGMISVLGWHTEISPNTVKTNPHWKLMKERGLETKVA